VIDPTLPASVCPTLCRSAANAERSPRA
jgi:hypothetical protein